MSGEFHFSRSSAAAKVAWHGTGSGRRTHEVGTLRPIALGLYDISGNVWEWIWNWFETYPSVAQTDPVGTSSGFDRVSRGGSRRSSTREVCSAVRHGLAPSVRYVLFGFRLVYP